MTVQITGRVLERETRRGVADLRVQAWSEAASAPAGEAPTNAEGYFAIDAGDERPAGTFFRVFRDGTLLASTEGVVVWRPEDPRAGVVIEVREPGAPAHRLRFRLLDARGGALPGRVVELRRGDGPLDGEVLGTYLSDERGEFVAYLRDVEGLAAAVHAPDGTPLGSAVLARRRDVVLLRTELTPDEPPDFALAVVAEALELRLPEDYLARLADAGVHTLGELGRAPDDLLPPDGESDDALRLRAAAGLRTLEVDLDVAAELLARGYDTLTAVAGAPRAAFSERMSARLGEPEAAALHASACAQRAFVDNVVVAERMESSREAARSDGATAPAGRSQGGCACEDCRSAVSPAAYLADLLSYAVGHVEDAGQPLTLARLAELTLQPLARLPLDCEASERPVRRIRIVVEVLRRYFTQAQPSALDAADRAYVVTAYLRLLAEHGTSFEELRAARLAPAAERAALAQRLGLDLEPPDPLAALFLDPDAAPTQLTEAALEQLFGYKATTTDPLADPPPGLLFDRRVEALRRNWLDADLPGDEYSSEHENQRLPAIDPDIVAPVDFRDQNPAGNPCFTLFNQRRAWVDGTLQQIRTDREANGVDHVLGQVLGQPLPDLNQLLADLGVAGAAAAAARTAIESLNLSLATFTRLMAIRAKDSAAAPSAPTAEEWRELEAILTQAAKVARFATWIQEEHTREVHLNFQRFRLVAPARVSPRPWLGESATRLAWQAALRRRAAAPVVDPDLLGPPDFRDPLPSGPLYQLWDGRRQWVQARAAQYGSGPPSLVRLDDMVTTVLDEMPGAEWAQLIERFKEGGSLLEAQEMYTIERGELAYLIRIRDVLESGQPVIDPEWEAAAAILTQVVKRRQFPRWRRRERQVRLALGPDAFVLAAAGAITPPARRGTLADRTAWQDRLRARVERRQSVADANEAAIHAAEAAALPALRDALVAATGAPGADLAEEADALGNRHLIDVRAGTCDITTRVAQAIESLQILLFSLRTAQLTDTHPQLALVADHFDEEWEWIGSYATWRAAMFVFLLPENLLLPSLRRQRTFGFRRLVQSLRGARRTTPERAADAAREYVRYFRDVCDLHIAASAMAATGGREYTYLFAQHYANRSTVYWSRHDASQPRDRAQTSWAPVNSLRDADVREVIGAVGVDLPGERWLYLFVRIYDDGEQKLALTRIALEGAPALEQLEDSGWEALQELDLPDGSAPWQAVLVQDHLPHPPELAILTGDRRVFLGRVSGTDWEGDWIERDLTETWTGLPPQNEMDELLGVAAVSGWGHLIFARYASGTVWMAFLATFQGLRAAQVVSSAVDRWQGMFLLDDRTQQPNASYPLARTVRVYAFWFDGFVSRYRSFGIGGSFTLFSIAQSTNSFLGDADGYLAVAGGDSAPFASSGSRVMLAYHRGGDFTGQGASEPGLFLTSVGRFAVDSVLFESDRRHIAPRFHGGDVFQIADYQRDTQQPSQVPNLVGNIRYWWQRGANALTSNRLYLEEAFGHVPLQVALTLQQRREYTAALDWFRVVYDYADPLSPKVYTGLVEEEAHPFTFSRAEDWLLDTMNPHAVAGTRRGAYTRFTLLSLVRCMLEFGDDLFTMDTGEAIARARVLYGTALELLDRPELSQGVDGCAAAIGELDVEVGGPEWVPVLRKWATDLLTLDDRAGIAAAVEDVNAALHADGSVEERVLGARAALDEALRRAPSVPTVRATVDAEARGLELAHRAVLRDQAVEGATASVGRSVRATVLGSPGTAVITGYFAPPPSFTFCVAPNPLPLALRLWAELNLFKIRTCRNIAGVERELEAYAAPTDTTSGLPAIGAGGQLTLPGARTYRPTAYRYPVLIARARELAELARQVEASMLAAIQAGDQERYNRLKADHDMAIGRAGVRLQDMRAREADGGVRLAELAKQRAALSMTHYTELLDEGPTATETAALVTLGIAAAFHAIAAYSSFGAAAVHGATAAALAATGVGAAEAAGHAASALSAVGAASSSTAAGLSTVSSLLTLQASFERRAQEWQYQRALAAQDVVIGDQEIQVAQDRVRVVAQEREIAMLHTEQAAQTIDFLDNKFTNVELYDFMADELERVYAFFLQQATSTAQLAASQLAFERQEDAPPSIRADYWLPADDGLGAGGGEPDRRGLTGSARLLADIAQLDAYAFETNRRKLHLTTTLSLAQLVPVEFARFRETGELRFETPAEWFDRQYPGHYLRLVRRVRLSVIALIPPSTGIRATIAQSGPSYVVIGGPTFSRIKVQSHGFDEVALSSPYSDSGVFELDPDPELRFPFEGIGLDTRWTLRLPRPANPFDFGTIADVLATIEYTALSDANLRERVLDSMNPVTEVTLPLSLRHRYPDQWYELHNRGDRTPPFLVDFELRESDLPANLIAPRLAHVALLVSPLSGELEGPITIDLLGRDLATGLVGTGAVTSAAGLASSRTNAHGWGGLPEDPVGRWVLQFKDEQLTRDLFDGDRLEDILLALTISGQTPPWV